MVTCYYENFTDVCPSGNLDIMDTVKVIQISYTVTYFYTVFFYSVIIIKQMMFRVKKDVQSKIAKAVQSKISKAVQSKIVKDVQSKIAKAVKGCS